MGDAGDAGDDVIAADAPGGPYVTPPAGVLNSLATTGAPNMRVVGVAASAAGLCCTCTFRVPGDAIQRLCPWSACSGQQPALVATSLRPRCSLDPVWPGLGAHLVQRLQLGRGHAIHMNGVGKPPSLVGKGSTSSPTSPLNMAGRNSGSAGSVGLGAVGLVQALGISTAGQVRVHSCRPSWRPALQIGAAGAGIGIGVDRVHQLVGRPAGSDQRPCGVLPSHPPGFAWTPGVILVTRASTKPPKPVLIGWLTWFSGRAKIALARSASGSSASARVPSEICSGFRPRLRRQVNVEAGAGGDLGAGGLRLRPGS